MVIQLHLHGILADITGEKQLSVSGLQDTSSLQKSVETSYPEIRKYLYRIAVNDQIINENTLLTTGDKVHFIPPFPGG